MRRVSFLINFFIIMVLPITAKAPFQEYIDSFLPDWSMEPILSIKIWQWIGIAVAIILGFIIKLLIRHLLGIIHKIATSKTKTQWDDHIINALRGPTGFMGAIGFWYLSIAILRFEKNAKAFLSNILLFLLYVSAIWLAYRLVNVFIDFLRSITSKTESTLDDQIIPIISKTLKVLVVGLGSMIVLQNFGINVFSLLAGLGIGGLAFALAAKDTASNFFGSFTIFTDRPFMLGDWVKIGSSEGIVEEIGMRSTRIRTFANTIIYIPNSVVANSTILNVSARKYRRTSTTLGLTYDTPPEKIEAFMEGVKNIILANPLTNKENFHVAFVNYGPSSLDIMVYFFLQVKDWGEELMGRQNIYLEILRLAKELKVSFAYPTQSLHIENFPEKKPLFPQESFTNEKIQSDAAKFAKGGEMAHPTGLGIFEPPYK